MRAKGLTFWQFWGSRFEVCKYRFVICISASEVYYWCLSAINCTGKSKSHNLLYALGEADANMYLCSKDFRPSENRCYLFFT